MRITDGCCRAQVLRSAPRALDRCASSATRAGGAARQELTDQVSAPAPRPPRSIEVTLHGRRALQGRATSAQDARTRRWRTTTTTLCSTWTLEGRGAAAARSSGSRLPAVRSAQRRAATRQGPYVAHVQLVLDVLPQFVGVKERSAPPAVPKRAAQGPQGKQASKQHPPGERAVVQACL